MAFTNNFPHFSFPSFLEERIQWGLEQEGTNTSEDKKLSQAVEALSAHYILRSSMAPIWDHSPHRIAYWCYFMPLNFLRLLAVFEEAYRLGFFSNTHEVIDFGAGIGTGFFAWQYFYQFISSSTASPSLLTNFYSLDSSRHATNQLRKINDQFPAYFPHQILNTQELPQASQDSSLLMLSYSLNEMPALPIPFLSFSHLLLLEPSTQTHSRKLMNLRQELIKAGYFIWAPCTHQELCPLFTQSQNDWCHDRIFIQPPDWFQRMEKRLPFKNTNISYSYLLASRMPPPPSLGQRIIGDTLNEKGKARQAICMGPKRQFLSWLKRNGSIPIIPHGSRIEIDEPYDSSKTEIRIKDNLNSLKVLFQHGDDLIKG